MVLRRLLPIRIIIMLIFAVPFVVVRQLTFRYRRFRVSGHGFENAVGEAVDRAAEQFVVGTVADAEVGGAGPFFAVGRVRGGVGGDGAGGAVGDEGWVGGYVGDQVVEGRGVVGEDAGGGEGLKGCEGVGDEGSGWVCGFEGEDDVGGGGFGEEG